MSREMSIRSLAQRQRLLEWSQRVADCRQSGLSVKRWCDANGVTTKTYYSWQRKVFSFMVEQQKLQLEVETQEGQEGCFVELPAPQQIQQTPSNLAASIQIGQASVSIYSGADPKLAQALILAMKSC